MTDVLLRRQAEDELIAELHLEDSDDPPSVGGANFNIHTLWTALVSERMKAKMVKSESRPRATYTLRLSHALSL